MKENNILYIHRECKANLTASVNVEEVWTAWIAPIKEPKIRNIIVDLIFILRTYFNKLIICQKANLWHRVYCILYNFFTVFLNFSYFHMPTEIRFESELYCVQRNYRIKYIYISFGHNISDRLYLDCSRVSRIHSPRPQCDWPAASGWSVSTPRLSRGTPPGFPLR